MKQKTEPESNADIIECYGKFPDDREKPETICHRRHTCEFAGPCLNLSREEKSNEHFRFQHALVPHIYYDPSNEMDETEAAIEKEYFSFKDQPIDNGSGDLKLIGLTIPADYRHLFVEIIQRLAEIKQTMPRVFDSLFDSIIHGKSQSDQAREKNVTRACVNKWLLKELNIAQKRNDIQARRDRELQQAKFQLQLAEEQALRKAEIFKKMSHTEFAVYKTCSEDGCLTISAISRILGYSRPRIYRALQNIERKYGITVTLLQSKEIKISKKYKRGKATNKKDS